MLLLEGHTSPVYALAFSPDGRFLASGTKDGAVWVWDEASEHRDFANWHQSYDAAPVNSLDWHPDGLWLAIGTAGGWSVHHPESDPPQLCAGPEGATAVRFLSTTLLAIGYGHRVKSEAGEFELWDLSAKRPREPYFQSPQGVRAVAVHPGLRRVAWAEWGRRLTVWDITSPDQARFNLTHDCAGLSFHPDGDRLAATVDRGVRVFDVPRRQERLAIKKGHTGMVSGVAFSPDGRALATGSWDETVRLWDPESGAERACYQWPIGRVSALAYSPDGLRMAAAGDKGVITVWDVG